MNNVQTTSITKLLMPILAVSALLVACGGGNNEENSYSRTVEAEWVRTADPSGGGNDTPPPAPTPDKVNTAEGFWGGPASTGFNVNLVVLDNGEAWGVYSSGNNIYGALQGTVTGDGNALSGSGSDYYFPDDQITSATVSGTVVQKTSIEAKTSTGVTMSLAYSVAYEQPASLDQLAGTYSIAGRTFGGYFGVNQLTIDSSGAFSLVDGDCTATGTVAPRAGGKNIFNLNVGFAGATCLLSDAVAGVAYLDTASNQFIALALNGGKSDGMIVVGSKH